MEEEKRKMRNMEMKKKGEGRDKGVFKSDESEKGY